MVPYMLKLLNPLICLEKTKLWEDELAINPENGYCFNAKHFSTSKRGPGSISFQENSISLCEPSAAPSTADVGRPDIYFFLKCTKIATDISEERKAFYFMEASTILGKVNLFEVVEECHDITI